MAGDFLIGANAGMTSSNCLTMKARALVAEFIGTFALVFVVFLTVTNFTGNPVQLLAVALAVGLEIMIMGTAFGPISGGHLNPSVTFGMLVARKVDLATGIAYIISQCLGGIVAVFIASYLLGPNSEAARTAVSINWGSGVDATRAILAEAVATFFFLIAIFMTAVDSRAPKVGGLYLGLTLTIGILAIGPISGGAINPAVGLGMTVGSNHWATALSWSVGPLLGAGLAGLLYSGMLEKQEA